MSTAMTNIISFLLNPAPAPVPSLLPTTSMDQYHKERNLKKHTLGIPAVTISALAIHSAQSACIILYGYKLALIFLLPGIYFCRMNLEHVGTVIFGLTLFAQIVVAFSGPIPMLIFAFTGALVFFAIVYLPTIVERRRRAAA